MSDSLENSWQVVCAATDVNDGELKYAFCEDVTVGVPEWTKSNVTFEGNDIIGQYSNVFGDDSNAFIGYQRSSNEVYFTYTNDPNPASGTINWTTLPISDK